MRYLETGATEPDLAKIPFQDVNKDSAEYLSRSDSDSGRARYQWTNKRLL